MHLPLCITFFPYLPNYRRLVGHTKPHVSRNPTDQISPLWMPSYMNYWSNVTSSTRARSDKGARPLSPSYSVHSCGCLPKNCILTHLRSCSGSHFLGSRLCCASPRLSYHPRVSAKKRSRPRAYELERPREFGRI